MSGEPLTSADRIVIVGASLAGARAAEALREDGFDGSLTMIGDEPHAPYDRPPLSKHFLGGLLDRAELDLLADPAALDARLLLGAAAVSLDPAARRVQLDGGQGVDYNALVIATGSRPRPLDHLLSAATSRVHVLRTVEDSARLAAAIGGRVVVIGGGFIGSEVASTALERGATVTMIEPLAGPMVRVLGDRAGQRMAEIMRAAGLDLRLGVGVVEICSDAGDTQVSVTLTDGSTVAADTVVVGIGAVPNTEWLAGSGLEVDDGVVCDAALFAADRIVAAGDVARWYRADLGATVRVEHWTTATQQARRAARNLLVGHDRAEPFREQPYVWSDQFGLRIEAVGLPSQGHVDEVVWGDVTTDSFVLAYRDGRRLTALVGVNAIRPLLGVRRSLNAGREFDEHIISALAPQIHSRGCA